MTMRNLKWLMLMAVCLQMACSNIDEADRIVYVKPPSVSRSVLIEDFTGQRCVNCPKATDEIKRLQEEYGEQNVIAVGIHSGPFAKSLRGIPLALYTSEGDEYYDYWKVESQPKGVINRRGTSDYTSWTTIVRDEMSKVAPVSLEAACVFDPQQSLFNFKVEVMAVDGATNGKLQVWLLENGIVEPQYLPDGSVDREYVHQHVFRTSVNGTWGTDLSLKEGERKIELFTYELRDETWVPANMEAVAFVYDDRGVSQVTKCKVHLLDEIVSE